MSAGMAATHVANSAMISLHNIVKLIWANQNVAKKGRAEGRNVWNHNLT